MEVTVEDSLEEENRLKVLTSCAAVAKVRAEVDKLSEQVSPFIHGSLVGGCTGRSCEWSDPGWREGNHEAI